MGSEVLYSATPIVECRCGRPESGRIFLKLENTQPSGSFKTRGISYHCQKLKERGCSYFVSSSGGNAGLAVAYSGRKLNIPVTVFVPETTPNHVIDLLKLERANVQRKGNVWDVTNQHAIEYVKGKGQEAALVHPFNHPEIWTGHSSIVKELKEQLDCQPSAVVLSVGGGGLLCGVLEGLHNVGWKDVPVVACETEGADCFNAAVEAGKLVTLPEITSVAKSLGSLTVLKEALVWMEKHTIIPVRVTDKEAVCACYRYLNDYKSMVEPACGVSLSVLYSNLLERLVKEGKLKDIANVVVIVCGGQSVKIEDIMKWKDEYKL